MSSILNDFRLDNCCGCGACISVCPVEAISYSKDEYEFTIPKVDENKCINCGKCISVCPLHSDREHQKVLSAYAAINRDEHSLMNSSSGGIFGAIAELVLRDGGVAYGVAMGDNFKVHHIRIDKIDNLHKIQRSKYVQSSMGDVFTEIVADVKNEKNVLFAGTPCQVESIRLYIEKCKLSSEKLLLVDIVCHGVPSQAFFDSYIENMQRKNKAEIEEYRFRAKTDAKNGMNWFFSYRNKKKTNCEVRNWPEDSFNYYYMKGAIYRDSCYQCKFAKPNRPGDITLCDFWGWEKYHAGDFEKDSTVSGVIINSSKGEEILNRLAGQVMIVPTEFDNIARHNSALVKSTGDNPVRAEIMEYWKMNGYRKLDQRFMRKYLPQRFKYLLLRRFPFIKKYFGR